jgi:hypothetical protein
MSVKMQKKEQTLKLTYEQFRKLSFRYANDATGGTFTEYFFDTDASDFAKHGGLVEVKITEQDGEFVLSMRLPKENFEHWRTITALEATQNIGHSCVCDGFLPAEVFDEDIIIGYKTCLDVDYLDIEIGAGTHVRLCECNILVGELTIYELRCEIKNAEQENALKRFLDERGITPIPQDKSLYWHCFNLEHGNAIIKRAKKLDPPEMGTPLSLAKYILQKYKKLVAELRAFDEVYAGNATPKTGTRRFLFFFTAAKYDEIKKLLDELPELFATTLKEYEPMFRDMFAQGLSLREYAERYLPDKSKKTAENAANRAYKALAAEYEKAGKQFYPKYAEMSPLHKKVIDDYIKIRLGVTQKQLEQLLQRGSERISNAEAQRDFAAIEDIAKFIKRLKD